jgi:predicted nucleotidyltransferase
MSTYSNLGDALFGQTRGALLAVLYGHTDQSFYLRQLMRLVGSGNGAVQREMKNLVSLGLIIRGSQGNQVLYRANPESPIFTEIRSLVAKTVGIHDSVRSALDPLAARIRVAFVYGSVARRQEVAASDVDLMVIGDVSFAEVVSAVTATQRILGREINPTVYSVKEFRKRLISHNHFLQSVMKEEKILILGSEDELAELAPKRAAHSAHNQRRRNSKSAGHLGS